MRILVLGGTRFAGRHFATKAIDFGHEVTLFHRGRTASGLFPEASEVLGDRDGGLSVLPDRNWDALVDFCGYLPRIVNQSAEFFENRIGRYLFVSSISVYRDFSREGLCEEDAVEMSGTDLSDTEEINAETYGPLKSACERIVLDSFVDRATILRPGLIVGPYDPTDRFTYWPVQFHRRRRVIAPEQTDNPAQWIDARDLAQFALKLLDESMGGVFNAVGPGTRTPFAAILEACQRSVRHRVEILRLSDAEIDALGLEAWNDFPAWISKDSEMRGVTRIDNSKAITEGLKFRNLDDTVADTLDWFQEQCVDRPLNAGLDPEVEQRILGR